MTLSDAPLNASRMPPVVFRRHGMEVRALPPLGRVPLCRAAGWHQPVVSVFPDDGVRN